MKKLIPMLLCFFLFVGCAPERPAELPPKITEAPAVPELLEGSSLEGLGCPFAEDLSDLSMRYYIYHFNSSESLEILDVHVPWTLTGGVTIVYTYLPWNEDGYGTPVIVSVLQGFKHEDVESAETPYTRLNSKAYYFSEELKDTVVYDNGEYFICDLTLILTGYETIDDYLREYPSYLTPIDDYSSAKKVYEHFHNDLDTLISEPE